MEKVAGYIIGGLVALALLAAVALVFGGLFAGGVAALMAFPVAAPLSTLAIAAGVGLGYLAYRRAKRKHRR